MSSQFQDGPLIDVRNNMCLQGSGFTLLMQPCDFNLRAQQWSFNMYTPEYYDFVKSQDPVQKTHYLTQLHAVIKAAELKDWPKVSELISQYTDTPPTTPFIPKQLKSHEDLNQRVMKPP